MSNRHWASIWLITSFMLSAIILNPVKAKDVGIDEDDRIQPYKENPMYWQYKGEPVLLLGGSTKDNLFQQAFSGLDEELYRLASYGGNYLRCNMSSGDEEDDYPFLFLKR